MAKKEKEQISPELREAIFDAARAGALEAYGDAGGSYVNYFKAMETLLYNFRKLAALVGNEEEYCEVEYHSGKKTFAHSPTQTGYVSRKTEEELVEDMREEKRKQYEETRKGFERLERAISLFADQKEFIVIRLYYFGEDINGNPRQDRRALTWPDISDVIGIDEKTARRWRNKIVNDMAVCIFGIPAAVNAGTYRVQNSKQG